MSFWFVARKRFHDEVKARIIRLGLSATTPVANRCWSDGQSGLRGVVRSDSLHCSDPERAIGTKTTVGLLLVVGLTVGLYSVLVFKVVGPCPPIRTATISVNFATHHPCACNRIQSLCSVLPS